MPKWDLNGHLCHFREPAILYTVPIILVLIHFHAFYNLSDVMFAFYFTL